MMYSIETMIQVRITGVFLYLENEMAHTAVTIFE